MTIDEFKSKINSLYRHVNGKITDSLMAKHLGVSIQDVRRFKAGKLPARYRREEIFKKLLATWVHYEGQGRADLESKIT